MMQSDAHADAERVQFDLLRQAGIRGRYRAFSDLTDEVFALSCRGLAKRWPTATADELRVRLVELCYGKTLAAAFAQRLRQR